MSVHFLRTARPAPPPPSLPPRPEMTYGIGCIARMFGLRDTASPQTIAAYLRPMIAHQGFPEPFPRPRGTKLLTGADAIGTHARWSRRAVDAWFDGLLPPGARETIAARAAAEAVAALDARADNLDALLAGRRA